MDRNRLLITGTGVVVFLAAVTALGIFWFYPRSDEGAQRAAVSQVEFDPFVQSDEPAADRDGDSDSSDADATGAADDVSDAEGMGIADDPEAIAALPGEREISEDGITVVFGTRDRETRLSRLRVPDERDDPGSRDAGEASREESAPVQRQPRAQQASQESPEPQAERQRASTQPAHEPSPQAAQQQPTEPEPVRSAAAASPQTESTETSRRASQEYWIQVFSGSSRSSAESAKQRFGEETSMHPLMTTIEHNGRLFYRLRVGPYPERGAAEALADQLAEGSSFSEAYVSVVYN